MSGAPRIVAGVLVGLAGGMVWAGPGGFTFAVPPGWVDLSPGAPAANRQKAPPQILAQADSGAYAFVAADVDHADDGFIETCNAVVRTGARPPLVTPGLLDEVEKAVNSQVAQRGMSFRALKKEVVKVGGVTAGRLVGELQTPEVVIRQIQYAIPGQLSHATLTCSTTADSFAHYEPIFDAAALATQGAVEPESRTLAIWKHAPRDAAIGAAAAFIAALVARRIKSKKKPGA